MSRRFVPGFIRHGIRPITETSHSFAQSERGAFGLGVSLELAGVPSRLE
jgi:hypothetical protein